MMVRERMDGLRGMLGYAILLGVAVIAVETFSVRAIQAGPAPKSKRSKTVGPNWVNMQSIWT